jgi:hypothetical protein
MYVTPETVHEQAEWVRDRTPAIVALINETRGSLAAQFDVDVATVSEAQVQAAVDDVFADGDLAVNVTALVALLRDLDVQDDYPGFVVDELLGRELAAMIAGGQPLRLLAEATFHYADVQTHGGPGDLAGVDDLDAALAAGFQTRLPGWPWREDPSPFGTGTE